MLFAEKKKASHERTITEPFPQALFARSNRKGLTDKALNFVKSNIAVTFSCTFNLAWRPPPNNSVLAEEFKYVQVFILIFHI